MTKKFLNRSQITTRCQQVCGERMAHGVDDGDDAFLVAFAHDAQGFGQGVIGAC